MKRLRQIMITADASSDFCANFGSLVVIYMYVCMYSTDRMRQTQWCAPLHLAFFCAVKSCVDNVPLGKLYTSAVAHVHWCAWNKAFSEFFTQEHTQHIQCHRVNKVIKKMQN